VLTIFSAVLLSGCVTRGSECFWTEVIYIGSEDSIRWLSSHDSSLLASVVTHNEKRAAFCP
jgi:hypothetical protein